MKRFCVNDNDCINNEYCSFDPETLTRNCISKKDLKVGCIERDENYKYIESNNENDHKTLENCINFSRKQTDENNYNYNYFIYKAKKNTPINKESINVSLSCDDINEITLSNSDFFEILCDDNEENCVLKNKKILNNFIENNTKKCKNNKLNVKYECENENINNNVVFDLNKNSENIKIDLNCPVNKNDDKNKSKCIAVMLENNEMGKYNIDNDLNNFNCLNPLYKLPIDVKDINKYKEYKKEKLNKKINKIESDISNNDKNIDNLKIERIIAQYELENGSTITIEQAKKILEREKELRRLELEEQLEEELRSNMVLENITSSTTTDTQRVDTLISVLKQNLTDERDNLHYQSDLLTQKIYMDQHKIELNNKLIKFLKTVSVISFIILIIFIVYYNYYYNKL